MDREKEDFYVLATLTVRGAPVERVPCKVFLPRIPTDRPHLEFSPTRSQAIAMERDYKAEFAAEIRDLSGTAVVLLRSPCIYFGPVQTRTWGHEVAYCTASAEAHDLHVLRRRSVVGAARATTLQFNLSPNDMLTPFGTMSVSFDGSSEFRAGECRSFELGDGLTMTFRRHFVSLPAPAKEIRRAWHLAGDCTATVDVADPGTVKTIVMERVDDFLALCSMASRQRTACLGWSGGGEDARAEFCRGNIAIPDGEKKPAFADGVVRLVDFNDFAQHAYNQLRASSFASEILAAAYSLTAPTKSLEADFLTTFASFERLILAFRRASGLEFVLAPQGDQWIALMKLLKDAVKATTGLEPQQRARIYEKLPELNRISLKTASQSFLQQFCIPHDDLWPLFGQGGLTAVRNLVIHGGFPSSLSRQLITARDHMTWLLERCVVRMLGWDVEKTLTTSAHLRAAGYTSFLRQSDDRAQVVAQAVDTNESQ